MRDSNHRFHRLTQIGWVRRAKARNPKHEIRDKFKIQMLKTLEAGGFTTSAEKSVVFLDEGVREDSFEG
jgi:hypothetical protein